MLSSEESGKPLKKESIEGNTKILNYGGGRSINKSKRINPFTKYDKKKK